MDHKLTEFVGLTGADPGLARDLLGATNWDVNSALTRYNSIKGLGVPQKHEPAPSLSPVSSTSSGSGAVSPSRPRLQKGQAVDEYKEKRLKRGISRATDNTLIITQARNLVINDLAESDEVSHTSLVETHEFTFVLPDLTTYSSDFRAFLEKDLIETSTMVSLEQAGRLNWWAETGACQRLWPLATTGDGNCLLHAASLGMWGFHDRLLTLRKALHNTLTSGPIKSALYRRWRWQQMVNNKEVGFEYSDSDWENEWGGLLKLASAEPRSQPGRPGSCCDSPATKGSLQRTATVSQVYYESLEEFHVFVLAHVLKRPVVVVADKFLKNFEGEAIAPIPFGGIYLPYECKPSDCQKSPLVLTYDAAHFSALVAMESTDASQLPVMIPLVGSDFELLPLHFSVDPGASFVWNRDEKDPKKISNLTPSSEEKLRLLREYLKVERLSIPKVSSPDRDDDVESKSSSGSLESEDSGGRMLTSQTSDSGKSDKEKSKMAKQMQTVAKQFGSIGKSMGKKLKNMGKAVKKDGSKDEKSGKKNRRKLSVGAVTQSTRVNLAELLEDREHILCAKLSNIRAVYHQDMIKNYLASAHSRFEQDRELRRQRAEEMRQRASRVMLQIDEPQEELTRCANSFCNKEAQETHNYLCNDCFKTQKQQAAEIKKSPNLKRLSHYDNVPDVTQSNQVVSNNAALARNGTIVASGNSKFYTPSETNLSYYGDSTAGTVPLRRKENITAPTGHPVPLRLSGSTFYESCGDASHSSKDVRPPNGNGSRQPMAAQALNSGYGNNSVSRVIVSNSRPPAPSRTPGGDPGTYGRPPRPMQVTRFVPCERPHQLIKTEETSSHAPSSRPLVVQQGVLRTGYGDFDRRMESALREQCGPTMNGPERNFVQRSPPEVWSAGDEVQRKCKSPNCKFFGNQGTDFLCSECFKNKQKTLAYIQSAQQTKM